MPSPFFMSSARPIRIHAVNLCDQPVAFVQFGRGMGMPGARPLGLDTRANHGYTPHVRPVDVSASFRPLS